jgi:hypothetical protein
MKYQDNAQKEFLSCPMCKGQMKDQIYTHARKEHGNFYCLNKNCFMPIINFNSMEEHKSIKDILMIKISKSEHCYNCGTNLPEGCNGIFKKDGDACLLNKIKEE